MRQIRMQLFSSQRARFYKENDKMCATVENQQMCLHYKCLYLSSLISMCCLHAVQTLQIYAFKVLFFKNSFF